MYLGCLTCILGVWTPLDEYALAGLALLRIGMDYHGLVWISMDGHGLAL